jgi:hypothetical protein
VSLFYPVVVAKLTVSSFRPNPLAQMVAHELELCMALTQVSATVDARIALLGMVMEVLLGGGTCDYEFLARSRPGTADAVATTMFVCGTSKTSRTKTVVIDLSDPMHCEGEARYVKVGRYETFLYGRRPTRPGLKSLKVTFTGDGAGASKGKMTIVSYDGKWVEKIFSII